MSNSNVNQLITYLFYLFHSENKGSIHTIDRTNTDKPKQNNLTRDSRLQLF